MWQKGAKGQANATPIQLSQEAHRDLKWLRQRFKRPPIRRLHSQGFNCPLTEWGPKSIAVQNWQQLAKEGQIIVVETDASKLHGWSYYIPKWQKVINGTWPPEFATKEVNAEFINYKEMWTIVECAKREGHQFSGWCVLFRTDNSCALHYIRYRYGRFASLERLIEPLEDSELLHGWWGQAAHIKGVDNVIADAGSRDLSFQDSWEQDRFFNATIRQAFWTHMCRQYMNPVLHHDLFADIEGQLSKGSQSWTHPLDSAFDHSLHIVVILRPLPPRALVGPFLQWLQKKRTGGETALMYLCIPEDTRAP